MKKLKVFAIATAVLLLGGCASPYQSYGFAGGFKETQLDTNVWRVFFEGNGYTKGDRAEDFAMLRSAELTLANGFTHFAFSSSKTGTDISSYSTPARAYSSSTSSSIRIYGGNTEIIAKPTATNIVVMFKGKPELNASVYDAIFICNSIGKKYEVVCNAPAR
jgi:hypothetical protein